MSAIPLESNSLWTETELPRFPKVGRSASYDVVIAGAGITGLTAAYLLKRAGFKVAVVEKGRLANAETGHTTAHLTQVTDTRLSELVRTFGKERARLAWEGQSAAINTIETIAAIEGIECHFQRVPGFLCSPITRDATTDDVESLEQEAELARELGFDALFISADPFFNRPAVRFSNQAVFHPRLYLAALVDRIAGDGCDVFEDSDVEKIVDDPQAAEVNGFRLEFRKFITATHVPIAGRMGFFNATLMQSKLAGYSTYVIGGEVEKGTVPAADIWDTQDPYYYLRIEPREHTDYVIFGGQDHKTGQETETDRRYEALESVLKAYLPGFQVQHRWSGQVIETPDGLPYIGEAIENQFIATGYAGNGMTFGTLAGMMACDDVLERDNPWADLFSPDRRALRGGLWDYIKENFSYPHHLIRGFLETPNAETPAEVKPGEGRVMKIDGHRCAVSRGHDGTLKTVSAICTHMGCVVRWNKAAETWDCPCHGSRFTPDGQVMAGPAESPLEKK